MYRVIKRDNSIVDFNLSKIKDAMSLAFQSQQKPCHPDVLDLLALKVTADFSSKVKDELVNVEDIQDSVESVLIQAGYADVAKAYILYRRQREKLRNMKNTFLDYRDTVNKYLNVTDWRVKENSTVTYSVGGLILSNSGAITANYWPLQSIFQRSATKWSIFSVSCRTNGRAHRRSVHSTHTLHRLSARII